MLPIVKLSHAIYKTLWHIAPFRPTVAGRFVYKRLVKAGIAPSYEFTADFFGVRYHGNLTNNIDFNVFYYGAFEKSLVYFLSDALNALAPRGIFIDIGANVGHHSLYMANFASKVHAFEPFAPVLEKLAAQIRRNSLDNIELHPVGLSDANTRMPFYAPTGRNAGIGSFDASTAQKGNQVIGDLELVRADDYFVRKGIKQVDLIKMDVEGFEKPALLGMKQVLEKSRPLVVMEITYRKPFSFTSLDDLKSALPDGYSLFTFKTRKASGKKARHREARSRVTGRYRIIPYVAFRTTSQDNIIACPDEKAELLPRKNRHSAD